MPSVLVDGATLHYSESGSGEPLVFVHGTGASADAWDKIVPLLAARFRVIIYDRRAYQRSSGSPHPAKGYFARHGEDLSRLLLALNASPAIIVGWSAGSFAALHAALAHPGQIQQLILYEPPFHAKANITWPLFRTFALVGLHRALGRPAKAADAFRRMVMAYSDGRNTLDSLTPELRSSMEKDTPTLLAELAAGTGEELAASTLSAQMKIPVKLLMGQHTPALFVSAIKRLKGVFPGAPIFTIPDANHFAQFDRPKAFVESLSEAIAA